MKVSSDINNLDSNVVSFKKYKDKKFDIVSSTIAAIIAIKFDHPENISPENFLFSKLESIDDTEVLAFENALENGNVALTTKDAQDQASNDA